MKFEITQTASFDILARLKSLNSLSDFLSKEFLSKDYGDGLKTFIVGVNCVSPELLIPPRDFDTGFLLVKKYVKSKRLLELQVKLNYGEVSKAMGDRLLDIAAKALLKTYSEVESMDIRNFDVGKFYNDLRNLLNDRSWFKEPYVEKRFSYHLPEQKRAIFLDSEKMPEDFFWELIEQARADSRGSFDKQVEIITNTLSKREEQDIIGFECTLRELLMKANHYNVMAVQKIVEGEVNDDSFLYFRCKLILYGKMTFDSAINNPNDIQVRIEPIISGEPLLSIADTAFKRKFGENNDKILPREYASEIIDYNVVHYEMQGKDWSEEEIRERYSKLWKAYLK